MWKSFLDFLLIGHTQHPNKTRCNYTTHILCLLACLCHLLFSLTRSSQGICPGSTSPLHHFLFLLAVIVLRGRESRRDRKSGGGSGMGWFLVLLAASPAGPPHSNLHCSTWRAWPPQALIEATRWPACCLFPASFSDRIFVAARIGVKLQVEVNTDFILTFVHAYGIFIA